jgi:hypothetical protein
MGKKRVVRFQGKLQLNALQEMHGHFATHGLTSPMQFF